MLFFCVQVEAEIWERETAGEGAAGGIRPVGVPQGVGYAVTARDVRPDDGVTITLPNAGLFRIYLVRP